MFELYGIPIIEAMYSKTPVITSKNGVFPEVGGPYSTYINPTDIEEIKNSILKLWNNEEYLNNTVEKSYLFVQKFNDEILSKEWEKIYKN